jgi:hypothetical protein
MHQEVTAVKGEVLYGDIATGYRWNLEKHTLMVSSSAILPPRRNPTRSSQLSGARCSGAYNLRSIPTTSRSPARNVERGMDCSVNPRKLSDRQARQATGGVRKMVAPKTPSLIFEI